MVLWECLAGVRLFQGKDDGDTVRKVARCEVPPASTLNADVPDELDQVLAALLARDPATRYQSARELGADLDYVAELLGEGDARGKTAELVRSRTAQGAAPLAPAVEHALAFADQHDPQPGSPTVARAPRKSAQPSWRSWRSCQRQKTTHPGQLSYPPSRAAEPTGVVLSHPCD